MRSDRTLTDQSISCIGFVSSWGGDRAGASGANRPQLFESSSFHRVCATGSRMLRSFASELLQLKGASRFRLCPRALALALVCTLLSPAAAYDASKKDVIGYTPQTCPDGTNFCSLCQNISDLWYSDSADPSWITFSQIFNATGAPQDIYPNNGAPIVSVRGQVFPGNQYHYFEFLVQQGDAYAAKDARRDSIYLTLVSPQSIPVANGKVSTASSVDSAKLPAYDFYVGQVEDSHLAAED
eukprot:749531-Hanusia_phi.AAC.2